jgi:hypothetical protein
MRGVVGFGDGEDCEVVAAERLAMFKTGILEGAVVSSQDS